MTTPGGSKLLSKIGQTLSAIRPAITVPFLVISLALAVLAYRSYQLSVRMERGLETLAVQYLGYASEMTARRVDAAIRNEITTAAEEWQEIERSTDLPQFESLRLWIDDHPWIVSAIYVPDADPEATVYVAEMVNHSGALDRLSGEFYTIGGVLKYTYDPQRLVAVARNVIELQPVIQTPHLPEAIELREHSRIEMIPSRGEIGLTDARGEASVVAPLASPLSDYAIRASISQTYLGTAWTNYRVVSLAFAAVALALLAFGANFALKGLRREAETNDLRAALIANVSHELRTPLSMIRLGAETLKRGGNRLSETQRGEISDSILREVVHLSHLVENVLDVARIQKGARAPVFAPVNPIELVRSVVNTYESWIKSKGFSVELDLDTNVGEQQWDREAVSRALLNLIDNAIKYSSDEKDVVVTLRERTESIELSVTDYGIGIPAEELQRIFEPYYRARFTDTETRRGAGLGLTLVQLIVQSHGGKVEVESTLGQGSTFKLLFPKTKAPSVQRIAQWDAVGQRP